MHDRDPRRGHGRLGVRWALLGRRLFYRRAPKRLDGRNLCGCDSTVYRATGMNIQLELRYVEQAQRPATAWWLAGDSPSAWLDEVAAWPMSHMELRLYRLPNQETRQLG